MYHFNIKAIGEDRGQGVLAAIDGAGLELLYVRIDDGGGGERAVEGEPCPGVIRACPMA